MTEFLIAAAAFLIGAVPAWIADRRRQRAFHRAMERLADDGPLATTLDQLTKDEP